jgi:hypothetical protein
MNEDSIKTFPAQAARGPFANPVCGALFRYSIFNSLMLAAIAEKHMAYFSAMANWIL